ncbi:MAG TPA: nuclear transport factor 2 family protein [Actinomycetes bacterium]|jgi:hypothetical protein|nr:nuclear transport factor 2 family protein [Actinomycetes bacterium]
MEEREVRDLLERLLTDLDPAVHYEVHHERFTAEMPQSGERLNRDNLRAMQEAYPNPPTFQLRRVVGAGDVWVIEALGHYSGKLYHMVMIVEFRDGKIWKETRYYAEPFEPPAWRAQWVERIEQPQASAVSQP